MTFKGGNNRGGEILKEVGGGNGFKQGLK